MFVQSQTFCSGFASLSHIV